MWSVGFSLLSAQSQRFAFEHPQMGTMFRIVLYANDSTEARIAAHKAFDRIDSLNHIMSDYDRESELNHLSATAGKDVWVTVSEDLWKILRLSTQISSQSDGAFDVTVGPMVQLWRRSRRKKQLPSNEALEKAKGEVGYFLIDFDTAHHTVKLTTSGMRLDLGGIAKGYAVDEALRVLKNEGFTKALVDGGGDIAIGDPPPQQDGWDVGIELLDSKKIISNRTLQLSNCAVATSGDTYRYVELDGVRYSHIIDPATGLGVKVRRKVTIISHTGVLADAYASTVSVLGIKGLDIIKGQEGTEVLIIENMDEQLHQTATPDFWTYIESQ